MLGDEIIRKKQIKIGQKKNIIHETNGMELKHFDWNLAEKFEMDQIQSEMKFVPGCFIF